ncbi:hypothetical protein HAX54_053053 [Datura stramonium]|uniref:Uncharacterized protein n=1 Tax=Datura stramonium TaxID=4076 RepID=A0ABS8T0I0_DATST|nr:hypothetical protein [Datura stramonium]
MIWNTTTTEAKGAEQATGRYGSPSSGNRQLVIYEDTPLPESSHHHPETSSQMLCTYQCRQMFHAFVSPMEHVGLDGVIDTMAQDNLIYKEDIEDAERKKFSDQFLNAEQELLLLKGRGGSAGPANEGGQRFSRLDSENSCSCTANLRGEEKVDKADSHFSSNKYRKRIILGGIAQLQSHFLCRGRCILERMEFRATNAEKESVHGRSSWKRTKEERLDEERCPGKRPEREGRVGLLKQRFQGDMEKLEDELNAWKSMIKDIPGASCAADVPPKFAALQRVGHLGVSFVDLMIDFNAGKLLPNYFLLIVRILILQRILPVLSFG